MTKTTTPSKTAMKLYNKFFPVFVYGTLKKGEGAHHFLANSEPLGKAVTSPNFSLWTYKGGFPLLRDGDTIVEGEVYLVTENVLQRLDQYEGVGHLYERITTTVNLLEQEKIKQLPVFAYKSLEQNTNKIDKTQIYINDNKEYWSRHDNQKMHCVRYD